ncbi:hypothetical protein D3C73_1185330 [compost metagenome]
MQRVGGAGLVRITIGGVDHLPGTDAPLRRLHDDAITLAGDLFGRGIDEDPHTAFDQVPGHAACVIQRLDTAGFRGQQATFENRRASHFPHLIRRDHMR